jgi:hypothetical protein
MPAMVRSYEWSHLTTAFRRTAERRNKIVQSHSSRQKKAHNEYHFVPSCRKTKSSPLTWPKNGPSLPPGLERGKIPDSLKTYGKTAEGIAKSFMLEHQTWQTGAKHEVPGLLEHRQRLVGQGRHEVV